MRKKAWIISTAALLALASCGDTLLEQGLMGAGAGAGAAIALGADPTTGAIVGAGGNIFCQNYSNKC